MKIVLLHGKDTNPAEKWYPWLGTWAKNNGYEFFAPALPNSTDPNMAEWLAEIDRAQPDEETILIGHSRGGVAVLRWLEKQAPDKKVKQVILVATNSGRLADKAIAKESNYGFYTETGYDFAKIKTHCPNFLVLHSTNDPWVPFSAGEFNAAGLAAKFMKFTNRRHFGPDTKEIPELIGEIAK